MNRRHQRLVAIELALGDGDVHLTGHAGLTSGAHEVQGLLVGGDDVLNRRDLCARGGDLQSGHDDAAADGEPSGVEALAGDLRVGGRELDLPMRSAEDIRVIADSDASRVGGKSWEGEGLGSEKVGAIGAPLDAAGAVHLRIKPAARGFDDLLRFCEVGPG